MDMNVFFMGVSAATAVLSLVTGLPWWVTAINVFAFTLNALLVFT